MSDIKNSNDLTLEEIGLVGEGLSSVSPSFCLAKYYQVTLNLHTGSAASCCLQPPRPLDDPEDLHNGKRHIRDRRALLDGERIAACAACWDAEEGGGISERYFKSGDHWAWPLLARAPGDTQRASPSYVEVGFSNECQMRCSYCGPENSSSIAKELEQYGPYPSNRTPPLGGAPEGSAEAFWRWLPGVYGGLKVLRVTGGEPLLEGRTDRLLDFIASHPKPDLQIEFNTNLSLAASLVDRFLDRLCALPRSHYGAIRFFVSLDCWARQAEYIRFGMKLGLVESNMERLFGRLPRAGVTITATVGALAVFSFRDLLVRVESWKRERGGRRVQLSAYPLRSPDFQGVALSGEVGLSALKEAESYVGLSAWFSAREAAMVANIRAACEAPLDATRRALLEAGLYSFFCEYDRRKGTDFLATFPPLADVFKRGASMLQETETKELRLRPFQILVEHGGLERAGVRQSLTKALAMLDIDDPIGWDIVSLCSEGAFEFGEVWGIISGLGADEAAQFTTPASTAKYIFFLYMTKKNKMPFIESLARLDQDQRFRAVHLRQDNLQGEKWSLEELFAVVSMDESLVVDNLWSLFEGEVCEDALEEIAASGYAHVFTELFLKDGNWDIAQRVASLAAGKREFRVGSGAAPAVSMGLDDAKADVGNVH